MSWRRDKRWADRFLPEMKRILGEHLIGEPPSVEDAERNTDLIVLKMEAVRIGCRARKHAYAIRYPNEFTIRAGRPSGTKTELAKIIEGWGDYFLYGFSDEAEEKLDGWLLGDLDVFRLWFSSQIVKQGGKMPGKLMANSDGSSVFRAFDVNSLPQDFVVASSNLKQSAFA